MEHETMKNLKNIVRLRVSNDQQSNQGLRFTQIKRRWKAILLRQSI